MKSVFTLFFVLLYAHIFAQSGALDKSFGVNGIFSFSENLQGGASAGIQTMAIQPDGKIILAGFGNTFLANGTQDFSILRINANGTIDNSFGNAGRTFIDFSNATEGAHTSDDRINGIALQPDGKIIVTGNVGLIPVLSTRPINESDIGVVRLNTNGSLDTTFNATGKKRIDLSAFTGSAINHDLCNGVVVRPNGKIVLGGSTLNNNAPNNVTGDDYDALLIQLNTDGSFDSSFHNNGIQIFVKPGSKDLVTGMSLQTDGSIILEGTTTDNISNDVLLIKANADGTLNNSFNGNGFVVTDIATNSDDNSNAVALQPNGKIVATGYIRINDSASNSFIVRYNADGTLDAGFGNGGKVIFSRDGDRNESSSLAVQQDGKIIISGSVNSNYYRGTGQVIRYQPNGILDSTFGTYGRTVEEGEGEAVAVQTDGKIVVAGPGEAAIRLLSSGRNYGLTGPHNVTANLFNQCTTTFSNLAPVLYPDTSLTAIRYKLYTNFNQPAFDSGIGCVDGKLFSLGTTHVEYYSIIDSNQSAYFTVTVNDAPATALDFDGVDDRIDLTGINNYTPVVSSSHTYSFEAWLKVKGYNQNEGGFGSVIFGNERNGDSGIIVSLDTSGFITTFQPNIGRVTSSYKIPVNTWTYIAFVQSPAKLDLYVNGNFVQTLLRAPNLHAATKNLYYIGAYTDDGAYFSRHFNGVIDNLRIWNTALCESQIQNNYHCQLQDGPYTLGLLAELNFNQGIASCKNSSINYVVCHAGAYSVANQATSNVLGTLENFSLDGPTSNWVADSGFVNGTCAVFTPLTISSHDNIHLFAQSGLCGAVANYAVTASSQCSDSVTISYSQNPGTIFPVGGTYITATATDGSGNSRFTNFYIYVTDTIPPALITKDTTIRLDKNGSASISPTSVVASITDNCSSQAAPHLTASQTSFNATGTYTINVTAQDSYNNTTTKPATVTILNYNDETGRSATDNVKALVSPNPSQSQFTVTVQSSNTLQNISVTISDARGKVLDIFSNVKTGEVIHLGAQYKAGVYIAVVKAGTYRKSYKLIKL